MIIEWNEETAEINLRIMSVNLLFRLPDELRNGTLEAFKSTEEITLCILTFFKIEVGT